MILTTVHSRSAQAERRLDAQYFLSPGARAAEAMLILSATGVKTISIGGDNGVGSVKPTTRTKRTYAGRGETGVPYLRPYDTFDYLPQPADFLAPETAAALVNAPGTILQTCSGRNLGPAAYCDEYLAGFAISDDMLRLSIEDEPTRMYVLAFMQSPMGQALLRRGKTGGVIDHLSVSDLEALEVPFFSEKAERISANMRNAVHAREVGRTLLAAAINELQDSQPPISQEYLLRDGWSVQATSLRGRLDAAFYDPNVTKVIRDLRQTNAVECGEVADLFIPGRYKRYYVEESYGRPIVSGRQLLQAQPVGLRYIAARSVDFAEFELKCDSIAFGAEGRAEDRIAFPSLVGADRQGWLANNHVMRVVPKSGATGASLFLAFATKHVQAQVKALCCGSVVDAVYPSDLAHVLLPHVTQDLAEQSARAWSLLCDARRLEQEAQSEVEEAITMRLNSVA